MLGQECTNYLAKKGFASAEALAASLSTPGRQAPCIENATAQRLFAPNPVPSIRGATDTTNLACRYGNPGMWGSGSTCCGQKPHFNWVVGTCEATQGAGQFCWLPSCVTEGAPKINYVAAYQFDGKEFVLMDESSAGQLSESGIAGNYNNRTGFEAAKSNFRWRGGDWTTKYAPWARGDGVDGPRGLTPPAALWVLSAENFYYGAFYMLSQLGINLEGKGYPTGTNCWTWELDPVEGTAGWSPGKPLPGNLNMLYTTDCAQASGCMPVAYSSWQANGMGSQFKVPEDFRAFCEQQPGATGCQPWKESISWSGGAGGSHRFENLWDEPYVFAIVIDAKGYWTYRWRPAAWAPGGDADALGQPTSAGPPAGEGVRTGWPGVERFRAARRLPARPHPVKDPRGLRTDVPGDVTEAVILQPGLSPEGACLRASIELPNWQFGANALGAMARELGEDEPGSNFAGAQSWWAHFADTQQNAGYPLSIAGVPTKEMTEALTCNTAGSFTCSCAAKRREEVLGGSPRSQMQGAANEVEEILV